ncbi:MAG: Coenzyme F420 hydrogenase/dehydrogenase, beta subunit C-terminal domain [Desulforhopalus sp.]|nr:Coenzyme F420 hydrogenase/dehydrogenase, beta subunit C-terminal domain [Desulforhopalus sp.]
MKTFFDLKQEVRATGRCHGCGGCVTFCTAVNYGALHMVDNVPRYKSVEKCIDCGLCYKICPVITEMNEPVKKLVEWSAPMGRVLDVTVAQIKDESIRDRAADGGVVTGLLLHMFDTGRIDGAIVIKNTPQGRKPILATTRQDLLESAGFYFNVEKGTNTLGESYSSYTPIAKALGSLMRQGLKRIAFVGTPCQIKSIRKMQALKIVPSDAIKFYFGRFCNANYDFSAGKAVELEKLAGCKMSDIKKMNFKEDLLLHHQDGSIQTIPIHDLDFAKRQTCLYCDDFTAEYSDISFGGIGADVGWTTVISRTPLGRAAFVDARDAVLNYKKIDDNLNLDAKILGKLQERSAEKRAAAEKKLAALE